MTVITHSCGAKWSGSSRAHCGGCHTTFSGDSAFDRHRRGDDGRQCLDPDAAGLVPRENRLGGVIWGHPGTWRPEPDGQEAS